MTAEVLKPKVQASGLGEVVALGISKKITEIALAPIVGNGSIKSALVKGVAGGVLHGRAGKVGNIVAGGLVVDAIEDAVQALLGGAIENAMSGMTGGNRDQADAW